MGFEYLQGGRLHNLSGQPVPVLGHPHSKKVLLNVLRGPPIFPFVPITSGPPATEKSLSPSSLYPPFRYLNILM